MSIWRTACRHIEVEESLSRIMELLRESMPVGGGVLYCVDATRRSAEQVYRQFPEPGCSVPVSLELAKGAFDRLVPWCRKGAPVRYDPATPPRHLPPLFFQDIETPMMALPLCTEHDTTGVLILAARAGSRFDEADESLAALICEPVGVAVGNDRRLRELVTLREAAEADKRKLLHRLGREHLSDEIIGAEGGLRLVMERVALVARSEVPVMILGETGSGKEVIARAIHDRSPLGSGPFIRVNCGAIPPELIDSELFGHERGSFTGATSMRKGWFERANEGTLFLDEIGELPGAVQVRLLRVLQEGVFERVGGEHPVHVHVRIVTATHRDLARMVQEHQFREDLWYRVAVFPILLPPLRERPEDIPPLATHFAHRAALRFGLRQQLPESGDIALLTAYDWPGNVRELASVIDRAAILGDGNGLETAKALGITRPARPVSPFMAQDTPGGSAAVEPLDEAMRRHIQRALAVTHGKVEGPGGAARLLEINPHTLRARMRKLGVDRKRSSG